MPLSAFIGCISSPDIILHFCNKQKGSTSPCESKMARCSDPFLHAPLLTYRRSLGYQQAQCLLDRRHLHREWTISWLSLDASLIWIPLCMLTTHCMASCRRERVEQLLVRLIFYHSSFDTKYEFRLSKGTILTGGMTSPMRVDVSTAQEKIFSFTPTFTLYHSQDLSTFLSIFQIIATLSNNSLNNHLPLPLLPI
jgi:hypothetical protein